MQVAIYSRLGNENQEQRLMQLIEMLQKQAKILLYEPLYRHIAEKYGLQLCADELFHSAADLSEDTVCVISVGGDGTMLNAAALVIDSRIPVVGLSTGRLGFLPVLKFENLQDTISLILQRKFDVEYRNLLQIQGLAANNMYALNDVCVQKRGSAIAEINVHIDNEFLSTYWADGLIVSTPTGSTAYSLSAGGPIVSPQAACFVVVPIAPHNLNVRPVVVPDTSVLSIEMHTRSKNIVVGVDSKEYEMPAGTKLIVQKAKQSVGFVKLHNTSFYQTLREKLLWGVDKRENR
jgi:NAD+ kinase